MVLRSRCSRSAAISASRSGRCSPRSSCCRTGSGSIAWFALAALGGMAILTGLGRWYQGQRPGASAGRARKAATSRSPLPRGQVTARDRGADRADLLEIFLPGQPHQLLHLLPDAPLRACRRRRRRSICSSSSPPSRPAPSIGGPIGDRIGRKTVIWGSILGRAAVHPGAALCRPDRRRSCSAS